MPYIELNETAETVTVFMPPKPQTQPVIHPLATPA